MRGLRVVGLAAALLAVMVWTTAVLGAQGNQTAPGAPDAAGVPETAAEASPPPASEPLPSEVAPSPAPFTISQVPDWAKSEAMTLFREALTLLAESGGEPASDLEVVRGALKAYMRGLDPFSDYLTAEEFAAYKHAQAGGYAGVGMDLFPDHRGNMVCIPFAGGPAAKAGVRYRDELRAVEGKPVDGMSVYDIGALVRGEAGTPVALTVVTPGEEPRTVDVKRDKVSVRTVSVFKNAKPLPVIKIHRFTDKTAAELVEAVDAIGRLDDKILDLRGNTGGDLKGALRVAEVFLEPGSRIGSVRVRTGVTDHVSSLEPADLYSRLFIWQDAMTASAAEIFTAALVLNGRALSIGQTSYGKGAAQRVVELSDGSALIMPYGTLFGPDGKPFQGTGLTPDVLLPPEEAGSDEAYANAVRKALKPELL